MKEATGSMTKYDSGLSDAARNDILRELQPNGLPGKLINTMNLNVLDKIFSFCWIEPLDDEKVEIIVWVKYLQNPSDCNFVPGQAKMTNAMLTPMKSNETLNDLYADLKGKYLHDHIKLYKFKSTNHWEEYKVSN